MPETPTSEGSIVAYLRVNDSDWNAKLDAAEQKARDLGRISPNIRVTADTADAIAKLDAARLAAERVGGNHVTTVTTVNESVSNATGSGQLAQAAATDTVTKASKQLEAAQNALTRAQAAQETASRAAANAASSQYLAELRLADVQDKRGRTEYQLAAAEEAAARASRNAEAAENREIAATDRLTAAQAALAAAEEAARHAQDDNTNSTDNAAKANAGNLGYMGMILAVVGALVPVMSQLAGFVAGVGGAFAGMGAAGVLAVLGIKNAMAAGTDLGKQYTDSVGQLRDALNGLEQTAAAGLLAPFQQTVAALMGAMPQLTSEISLFSADLGGIANSVIGALIQGFQVMNPLFQEGADYLGHLAGEWSAWVSGGGLMQFALDAERALPEVASALGSVVKGAIDLIGALAPIGSVVLPIITGFGDLVQLLASAGPYLSVVAGGAAAAFGAFKLWGAIGPLVASAANAVYGLTDSTIALGVALDATSGPVGWVMAGIGALTAAIGIGVATTQQATQAEASYASALQVSNGAIDEHVRKQVASNLETAGVLETAKQYHLQLSTVTDAVLGNADAQQKVNDAIQKYGMVSVQAHGKDTQFITSAKTMTSDERALSDAVNGQNKSLNDQVQAFRDQAAAAGQSANANASLSAVQNQLSDAQATVTKDTTALANALTALGQVNRSADQANIAYQQSLATASTAVKQNGKSLDETTVAGRANATALDGIANAGIALIAAQAKQDASEATLQATMTTTRQNFIDTAIKMGDTADQANHLADQYGLIPSQVATVYTTSGLGDAIQQVQTLQNAITTLLSDENAVNLGGNVAGYYGFGAQRLPGHAWGGVVSAAGHAAGGQVTGPGNAMSDTAGNYYPVSDGEWIISNMAGQSTKWSPVLDMINRNLGPQKILGQVMSIAGVHAQQQPQPRPAINVTMNITTNNGEQLFQTFQAKVNALAGP